MTTAESLHQLELLILSSHPVIICETSDEERISKMLRHVGQKLLLQVLDWSSVKGFVIQNLIQPESNDPIACLQFIKTFNGRAIFILNDFLTQLKSATEIRLFREVANAIAKKGSTIVLCSPKIEVPVEIEYLCAPFSFSGPDRQELKAIFESVVESLMRNRKLNAALPNLNTNIQMDSLLSALSGLSALQARQLLTYSMLDEGKLAAPNIDLILKRKAEMLKDLGAVEFYPVSAKTHLVGGFKGLKNWLSTANLAFSEEAKALNIPAPRGILLVGVPGCGKSLSAKMIASQWHQPLLRLDVARLFDKYVGGSERNFAKVTEVARAMSPCILWIDEIEKIFGGGSSSEADGGSSQRLFGAFLTWLQEKQDDIFLLATANDLSKLPAELLRKGRFDEIFFVDLPNEKERTEILEVILSHHNLDPAKFELAAMARATHGFSGAEIDQTLVMALLKSLQLHSPFTVELFNAEAAGISPLSVSQAEKIDEMRASAQGKYRMVS